MRKCTGADGVAFFPQHVTGWRFGDTYDGDDDCRHHFQKIKRSFILLLISVAITSIATWSFSIMLCILPLNFASEFWCKQLKACLNIPASEALIKTKRLKKSKIHCIFWWLYICPLDNDMTHREHDFFLCSFQACLFELINR